jgi:hypothetical protein
MRNTEELLPLASPNAMRFSLSVFIGFTFLFFFSRAYTQRERARFVQGRIQRQLL